jgi:valyl-tRNA synthetase
MTNRQLPKSYDPTEVEPKWYRYWQDHDYFHADATTPKTPFCIVIPPPNVTGSLHMGHAIFVTIQDSLTRWRRMQGYNALWLPGTDHAGIATQMVVERLIQRTEKKSRHDLGREEFLKRVWQYKEKFGGRIVEQMKTMGASLDWRRERFTMDDGLSKAVREAFVRLHEEGLIYRAKRLINWCSRCLTALSDLEVESKDEQGSLWHISYDVAGTNEKLVVATTRPETLLGDTAVAVHPDDPRFKHLIGKKAIVPLAGREIPIIGDAELVSMEFGTGAVKVTPGHDFNDFETGLRHNLEQLSILDLNGRIIDPAPEKYRGQTVAQARKAVLEDLEASGQLVKTEPHTLALGRCQRCDTVVEPLLSMQWFVKTKPLAEPAIAAVNEGKTRFVPEMWTKTYMHWMTNIKDWCISRQLWWGHRIPAWYCDACSEITVARETPQACKCGKPGAELRQDEDVLDTWFSSALWPFSTLGWPEQTRELKTFYPTTVMETGYDILFFWVARMMMMGIHFMKKVPFRTVYLHALVVDENGDKMSKVKGNVIDPLDVIHGATQEQLLDKAKDGGSPESALNNIKKSFPDGIPASGADALRFALAAMAAQGRNIRLSIPRIEGYRHFANKIWNASRFALMNLEGFDADRFVDTLREGPEKAGLSIADRWILSRLHGVIKEVDDAMESYRLNDAAQALYRFIWTEVCDWYIELAKPALYENEQGDAAHANKRRLAQGTLALVLEHAMRLLHPLMPYLTEEIWQTLPKPSGAPGSIMITLYPIADEALRDPEVEKQMELLMETTVALRNLRAEYNLPGSKPITAHLRVADPVKRDTLRTHAALVERGSRFTLSVEGETAPKVEGFAARAVVAGDIEVVVPLADVVDIGAEKTRLEKDLAKARKDAEGLERKLGNASFVERAPAEVVEENRARLAETKATATRLEAAIAALAVVK